MMNQLISAISHMISSGLFFDEIMHGVVTVPFVIFLYYKTKSIKYSLIPLAVTYLIDMDHWFDYFLYYGLDINLTNFVNNSYFEGTNRAIVPLHAWEWLFFVSAIALDKGKWKSVYTAVALGILAHLLWDSHTVGSAIFYSILYRISHGFMIVI